MNGVATPVYWEIGQVDQAGLFSSIPPGVYCGWFGSDPTQPWLSITYNAATSLYYSNVCLSYYPGAPYIQATNPADGTTSAPAQIVLSGSVSPPILNPTSNPNIGTSGGTFSFQVSSTTNWTATSNNPSWLTVTCPNGGSGSGNGSVCYVVAANTGAQRTGTISVSGATFTVTQAAAATEVVYPTSAEFTSSGGTGSFSVTSSESWTVSSNKSWITITSPSSGHGSGNRTISYSVGVYRSSDARTGIITVGAAQFTVTEDGIPITLNPTSAQYQSTGGSGSISVTARGNWTASSDSTCLQITSGSSGSNNGSINYAVSTNNSGNTLTGNISVGSTAFAVTEQAGAQPSASAGFHPPILPDGNTRDYPYYCTNIDCTTIGACSVKVLGQNLTDTTVSALPDPQQRSQGSVLIHFQAASTAKIGYRDLVCSYGQNGLQSIKADYGPHVAGVSVQSVTFSGPPYIPIIIDKIGSATPNTTPQWGAVVDPLINQPVAYPAGTKMTVTAQFYVSLPHPDRDVSGLIGGSIAGLGTLPKGSVTIGPNSPASLYLTYTPDAAFPSTTKFYNPMVINWSYSSDSCPSCSEVGSTGGRVYVTLMPPTLALVYLTPLHLAISNDGAATPADVFQKTWAKFAGPANVTGWDGRRLYYYPPGVGFAPACAYDPRDLLTSSTGGGECGAFAKLFLWALGIGGLPVSYASPVPPTPTGPLATFATVFTKDSKYFLVRDWNFSDPGTYAGDPSQYWWSMITNAQDPVTGRQDWMVPPQLGDIYGDLTNLNTLQGQNTAPPSEKMFGSHYIVKADGSLYNSSLGYGPYFDPSYGVTYADSGDFERTAVNGYVQRDLVNFPDDTSRWIVINTQAFGPQGDISLNP